jgi:DNA-binding PadR family transcriptional regulator
MPAHSPQVFQILLSLADGPLHGYAIVQDIRTRTNDEVRLTASTLYDALLRLVDQGWIVELEKPPDPADHDSRRRYYQLTRLGREAVAHEVRRMERLLEMARAKRLLPAPARGRK